MRKNWTPIPCKFALDDGPVFDGFYYAEMPSWNGWLQPYVDIHTMWRIFGLFFIDHAKDADSINDYEVETLFEYFMQKPDANGLYSVGWDWCWSLVEDKTEGADQ